MLRAFNRAPSAAARVGERRTPTMAMMQICGAAAKRMMSTVTVKMAPSFSSSLMAAPVAGAPILCGRGDMRTKKGKRFRGTFGNSRPKKEKKQERIKDKVEVPRSTPWPLPFKLI